MPFNWGPSGWIINACKRLLVHPLTYAGPLEAEQSFAGSPTAAAESWSSSFVLVFLAVCVEQTLSAAQQPHGSPVGPGAPGAGRLRYVGHIPPTRWAGAASFLPSPSLCHQVQGSWGTWVWGVSWPLQGSSRWALACWTLESPLPDRLPPLAAEAPPPLPQSPYWQPLGGCSPSCFWRWEKKTNCYISTLSSFCLKRKKQFSFLKSATADLARARLLRLMAPVTS